MKYSYFNDISRYFGSTKISLNLQWYELRYSDFNDISRKNIHQFYNDICDFKTTKISLNLQWYELKHSYFNDISKTTKISTNIKWYLRYHSDKPLISMILALWVPSLILVHSYQWSECTQIIATQIILIWPFLSTSHVEFKICQVILACKIEG